MKNIRRKLPKSNRVKIRSKNKKTKTSMPEEKEEKGDLSYQLDENENKLRSVYSDCYDVVFRSFLIGGNQKALLIYTEGLSNTEEIDDSILLPLMKDDLEESGNADRLIEKRISVASVKEVNTFSKIIQAISSGSSVLLVENWKKGLVFGLKKSEKRSIEEPSAERVVRGPREGFIESISVNTSLLRRRIRSPKFKMKPMYIGKYTETKLVVAYIEGIADQTLIEEVQKRLNKIEIDGVLASGMIEEFIEDNPYSPFPQILATERPDVVAANLLEGRVAILVDGTPFSIIAPITLYSMLQASEDYYGRFLIGTAIRWLRFLFFVIALILPSFYVAVITFHQEMIPTSLLVSMAASREQVPFPALVEAIMMEITFEALREAGIRLPKQIGTAISIVGALIIGEAAVQAGIVSAPMVIVVALTGVASFTIPRYSASIAIRMLRFPMIVLAGTLGLLGVMLGIIMVIIHLATLRSFGVPYLSPMAPMNAPEMKDVLIRAPWWKLNTRPHFTGEYNKYRQSPSRKPDPSRGSE